MSINENHSTLFELKWRTSCETDIEIFKINSVAKNKYLEQKCENQHTLVKNLKSLYRYSQCTAKVICTNTFAAHKGLHQGY